MTVLGHSSVTVTKTISDDGSSWTVDKVQRAAVERLGFLFEDDDEEGHAADDAEECADE